MNRLLHNQPVFVGAIVSVLVAVAAGFGLDLTAEQVATLTSVVGSVVAALVWRAVSPANPIPKTGPTE